MIPKNEMRNGWYKGFCRNNYMAYWDEKEQIFYYLTFAFIYHKDTIEHFEDVKDKGVDGFVPVERIERIPIDEQWKIKDEIGY
jgi:hypothetical protein